MPSPQTAASQNGHAVGSPAQLAEGSGSGLSGALGASSGAEHDAVAAAAAASDRSVSMSGVLSGGGSIPGTTAAKLPRWKGKRIGRYRLVEVLGKGSYGRVFLADDVDLRRQVALKIVSAESTANNLREDKAQVQGPSQTGTGTGAPTTEHLESLAAKVVERTLTEARAAARIEHPNVVHVYEVGRLPAPPGTPPGTILGGFIAMELLEGGTLQDLIKQHGPMSIARACALVADAAEALQFAHDQGVVHRDVKPANLMLSRHGRCKVVDFGLAMEHDPDGSRKTPIAGTLMFVAPEVTLGEPPGPKSDQYSLGITLYALLSGRPPYNGDKQQLLDGHRSGTPPSLRALRPEIPEALEMAILRAMEKDPARRFHTIRQFGQTLRTFTGEATAEDATASFLPDLFADLEDPTAPPEPPKRTAPPPVVQLKSPAPPPKPSQKAVVWPWIVIGGVAVVLMLSLIVWAVLASSGEEPKPLVVDSQAAPPPRTNVDVPRVVNREQPNAAPQQRPQEVPGQQAAAQPLQGTGSQGAAPQPQQTSQRPEDSGNTASATPPMDPGASTVPPAEPPQPQNPVAEQTPGQPQEQKPAEAANLAPAAAANAAPVSAGDFAQLTRIANGADPDRPDKRAVIEGQAAAVTVQEDGMLRIDFASRIPRRNFSAVIDISDAQLLKNLQQKFDNRTKSFGIEGRTVLVRGQLSLVQGSPTIIITSADQIEGVPPGKETFPPAPPGQQMPPNRRGPPGRNG